MIQAAIQGAALGDMATDAHIESSLEWEDFFKGVQLAIGPTRLWSLREVGTMVLWLPLQSL